MIIDAPGDAFDARGAAQLQDVARLTCVALTTALHVLSGKRPVSTAPRATVLRGASDLGLVGHTELAARTFGSCFARRRPLPALAAGPESFARLIGAVTRAMLARGHNGLSLNDPSDVGMQIGRVHAFALLPNRNDAVLRNVIARGIPAVTYEPDLGAPDHRWWVAATTAAPAVDSATFLTAAADASLYWRDGPTTCT